MKKPPSNQVIIGDKDWRFYAGEIVKTFNYWNDAILKFHEKYGDKAGLLVKVFKPLGCRNIEETKVERRNVQRQMLSFDGQYSKNGKQGVVVVFTDSGELKFVD